MTSFGEDAAFKDKNFLLRKDVSISEIDCVMRAIYDLSFAKYLKTNGYTESDLKKDPTRLPSAWPSTSHFIFSLEQMREAYAALAAIPQASIFMSERQKSSALARNRSKKELWSILGEARDAFESFKGQENMIKLQQQARAFRLILFQNKIEDYETRSNFIHLIKSVSAKAARLAFKQCVPMLFGMHQDVIDAFDFPSQPATVDEKSQKKNAAFRQQVEKLLAENQLVQQQLADLNRQMEKLLQDAPECE